MNRTCRICGDYTEHNVYVGHVEQGGYVSQRESSEHIECVEHIAHIEYVEHRGHVEEMECVGHGDILQDAGNTQNMQNVWKMRKELQKKTWKVIDILNTWGILEDTLNVCRSHREHSGCRMCEVCGRYRRVLGEQEVQCGGGVQEVYYVEQKV